MKKKTRRKVLYALSTLLSAFSSPGAYAKIPPTAFKGVTKCFKEKKEHFSPTLGEAALDSGLIYNLRFYGNFTVAKSSEGIRQYKDDESQDPLWNMVKILFPSTGGQLSTEANHPMAFGRLMNTPEAVSLLLNFVNNVRDGKLNEALENELKDDLFKSMTDKTRVESLEKARDALEEKLGAIRLEGRQSSLGNIKSKILTVIQEIENPSKKEAKIKLDHKIREDIIKIFQDGMAKENTNNEEIIYKLEAMRKQAQDEIDQFYKEKIDKIKGANEATLDDSSIIKIRNLEQEWNALKDGLGDIQFEKLESPLKQAPSRIVDATDKQKITIQEENETIRKRIRNIFQDGVKEEALEQSNKQLNEIKAKALDAVKKFYENKIKDVKQTFNKGVFEPLIQAMKGALASEGNSVYPAYTTEQVILAFFCHKFNTQGDIWDLMKSLDESIVERAKVEERLNAKNKEDLILKEGDLEEIINQDVYDLDDILALETADIWSMSTPHRSGSSLISNGGALSYDREKDQLFGEEKFADCEGTALRHFLNMLLYNPETRNWDLSYIEKYVEKRIRETNTENLYSENRYFKNFKEFYEIQAPARANDGDPYMRSLFNKIIGDLNPKNLTEDPSMPRIRYAHINNNQLRAGFINFIHVFQRLFNLDLKPMTDFKGKNQWLEDAFRELCTALNPTKSLKLDTSKLSEEEGEIAGKLSITVQDNKEIQALPFSFIFDVDANRHADIKDLRTIGEESSINRYTTDLNKKGNKIAEETAEESIWLLSTSPDLKNKITQPLYALFSTSLADNRDKIHFLETLSKSFLKLEKKEEMLPQLRIMLKNVLEGIVYEDQGTLVKLFHPIFELSRIEEFKDIIFDSTFGLAVNRSWGDPQEIPDKFQNIQRLYFYNVGISSFEKFEKFKDLKGLTMEKVSVERLMLDHFKHLQIVNLKSSSLREVSLNGLEDLILLNLEDTPVQKIIGLQSLKNLQYLILRNTSNLKQTISLTDFKNLKQLNLGGSAITDVEGLETLTNLEMLNLRDTKNLKGRIFLKDLKNLKQLNLSGSALTSVEGLETLTNLEVLNLSDTKNLKGKISLENLKSLKQLNLSGNAITDVEGLETLTNLEELNLKVTLDHDEFSLKDLPSLKSLFLTSDGENLPAAKIKIGNLPKLENLLLSGFSEISLKNLTSLTSLDLFNPALTKIYLDTLTNLKSLDLNGAYNLSEISLQNLPKLTSLDLAASSVTKIEGLETLTNLEVLNLRDTKNLEGKILLTDLKNIKQLNLSDSALRNVEGLETLTNLEVLNLRGTKKLEGKISLKDLKNLKQLNLSGSALTNVEGLETLTNLEVLNLSYTRNFTGKISLNDLKNLKQLDLKGSAYTRIEELPNLANLEELDLKVRQGLRESSLQNLPSLKSLKLLCDLSFFASKTIKLDHHPKLENIYIDGKFKELSLKNLTNLTTLELTHSAKENIKKIHLDALTNLKNLYLNNTESVDNVLLENLTKLEYLGLFDCSVQHLVLKNLTSLSQLNLSWCRKLKSISFEGDFSALQEVAFPKIDTNIELHWKGCTWHQDIAFVEAPPAIATSMKELDEGTLGLHGK